MQCPRCGLQNPPGITACQRCGLAVVQAPPAGGSAATPEAGDPASSTPSGGGYAAPAPYQPSPGQQGYAAPAYGQSQPGYGQAAPPGYGQPGYGSGEYGSGGYGQQSSSQPYLQYGQASSPPSYQTPYGTAAASPYATGPVSPYGSPGTATWPQDTRTASTGGGGGLARVLLLLAAVASLVYAVWAMTARRGIFADFADNKAVSLSHAKSSDRTDTILLVIAGALAVIALALWLVRLLGGKSRGGGLTLLGFVVSGLGMVCVVVGLVLSGMVGDGSDRVDQGNRAVTSTIVTGSGFIALALGLVIGLLVVNARRQTAGGDVQPDQASTSAGWTPI